MKFGFWKTAEAEVPEQKASAAAPVIAFGRGASSVWGARDGVGMVRSGYVGNPVGFRAVRLIAEAAGAVPLVLQDVGQRYERHPVLDLLQRPNPSQRQAELIEALVSQLLLSGNGYVEAVGAEGWPGELHVLRSDRVSVVPGADGWPAGYDYAVGGKRHRYDMRGDVKPICHVRAFHPLDDHYGLSPMRAAAGAVDVHNAASAWSKALLDNAARPSGAIVYKSVDGQGSLSVDQYDRLISEMESHHQGARNAGRPMLLEGGLDWKPMGFSPSDMEFQKTKEAAAREIAQAFGVPPMLLGIPGDATYANYQEANRAFYRLTVLPMIGKVAAALGNWLSEFGEGQVWLKPDLDQVPALATERESQWKRIGEALFLSDAEKRAMLGLPPKDQSDG
ncbi:MAG: phage portal protein [Paracoccaceae bacterium]|jgi:HK97 family phage portal protein|nr:phage portal protein [Paracoccaceae bacterium]MDP7186901.1 phage portal protein [Paracoccaceae bacterium]